MTRRRSIRGAILAALIAVGPLAACAVPADREQDYPNPEYESRTSHRERIEALKGGDETLFGELSLGGETETRGEPGGFSTVNYFLWRATLETLSVGPLESADPFGGVVITDWFTLDEAPGSRYRVTAYILGRELRTDNVKVALYVKRRDVNGEVTERGSPTAETKLEDVILAKARDIRATHYR